jgi:hypothetical protein
MYVQPKSDCPHIEKEWLMPLQQFKNLDCKIIVKFSQESQMQ